MCENALYSNNLLSYNVYYVNLVKLIHRSAAAALEIVTEDPDEKEQFNAKKPPTLKLNPYQPKLNYSVRSQNIHSLTDMIPISKELPPTPEFFTEADFWEIFEKVFSEYSEEIQKARTFKVPRETKNGCGAEFRYPDKIFPNIGIKV